MKHVSRSTWLSFDSNPRPTPPVCHRHQLVTAATILSLVLVTLHKTKEHMPMNTVLLKKVLPIAFNMFKRHRQIQWCRNRFTCNRHPSRTHPEYISQRRLSHRGLRFIHRSLLHPKRCLRSFHPSINHWKKYHIIQLRPESSVMTLYPFQVLMRRSPILHHDLDGTRFDDLLRACFLDISPNTWLHSPSLNHCIVYNVM